MIELGGAMTGEGCRGEPFAEHHREDLKGACAEDTEIWAIYSTPFDPAHFDESIDRLVAGSLNRVFALYDGDELAGMSSFGNRLAMESWPQVSVAVRVSDFKPTTAAVCR